MGTVSGTILDLAQDYEREVGSLRTSQRRRWALQESANLFRRMVCNREAAHPAKLKLSLALLLDVAERWCRQHGYQAVAGHGGWVIQRGNEPALIAAFGDTLLWDGQELRVQYR